MKNDLEVNVEKKNNESSQRAEKVAVSRHDSNNEIRSKMTMTVTPGNNYSDNQGNVYDHAWRLLLNQDHWMHQDITRNDPGLLERKLNASSHSNVTIN